MIDVSFYVENGYYREFTYIKTGDFSTLFVHKFYQ